MHTVFMPHFKNFFGQLKKEINSYENPEKLWTVEGTILNSGGNLCTHLLGNLNYFIGTLLAKNGYVRQRDLEFSIKNVPIEELNKQIDDTFKMVEKTLSQIPDWDAPYPENLYDKSGSVQYQVARILAHMSYHVGQLNYHRRLVDGK